MSTRKEKLEAMLQREPNDPFLIYGLALEYRNTNELDRAAELLTRVIQIDPGYCYAYFQLGQIQSMGGDNSAAGQTFRRGIAAAVNKGDAHAHQEIAGALAELPQEGIGS